jgi:hypothetical protein
LFVRSFHFFNPLFFASLAPLLRMIGFFGERRATS